MQKKHLAKFKIYSWLKKPSANSEQKGLLQPDTPQLTSRLMVNIEWCGFDSWPRKFHMPKEQPKKKRKKKRRNKIYPTQKDKEKQIVFIPG